MGVGDSVKWTIKASGEIDDYIHKLEQMHANTEEMIGRAIFPGAAIVADAVRSSIESIPEAPKQYARGMKTGLTASQKAGLLDGLGIAMADSLTSKSAWTATTRPSRSDGQTVSRMRSSSELWKVAHHFKPVSRSLLRRYGLREMRRYRK